MTEITCALSILQKNEYIKVKDSIIKYPQVNQNGKEIHKEMLEIPGIAIHISQKNMGEFRNELNKKMEDNNYLSIYAPTDWKFYCKKEDIIEICKSEPFTTQEVIYFENEIDDKIIKIMKEYFDNNSSYEFGTKTYYPCSGVWGTLIKITNLDIKKERKDNEKRKENDALELLNKVF